MQTIERTAGGSLCYRSAAESVNDEAPSRCVLGEPVGAGVWLGTSGEQLQDQPGITS